MLLGPTSSVVVLVGLSAVLVLVLIVVYTNYQHCKKLRIIKRTSSYANLCWVRCRFRFLASRFRRLRLLASCGRRFRLLGRCRCCDFARRWLGGLGRGTADVVGATTSNTRDDVCLARFEIGVLLGWHLPLN